jgi:hypothetical protein
LVAPGPESSERERRALVGRVLQSRALSSSHALQAFLQFVTDRAVCGDLDAIKEKRIGSEVLGRKDDYDPAVDNIVRVRAHELRQKLAKYFSTEGADEPIVITIPKGSYVPVFIPRPSEAPPPPPAPELATVVAPAQLAPKASGIPPWMPWTICALLFAALAVRALVPSGAASAGNSGLAASPPIRDLWAQFFHDNERELTFVSADSGFALWQDMAGQNVELGEYITRKFVQDSSPQLSEVASRLVTSPADVTVALEMDQVSNAFRGHLRHRNARDMTSGELRTGNAVLLGSRRSNPWVGLFEPRMNFVLTMNNDTGAPNFHNKAPQQGEVTDVTIPSRFDSAAAEKHQMVSYAVAALLPNLAGTGFVLLVEGLSMEGTAAAGDVLTHADKLAILLRKLGHKPGTAVKPFEVLMKLTSVPGGFAYPEVVASRSPAP